LQPANAQDEIDAIEMLGSPVKAFVRDRCLVGATHSVLIDDLFSAWKDWCEVEGRHADSREWFGRNLKSAVQGLRVVRTMREGISFRAYQGIDLAPLTSQPISFGSHAPG